MTDKPAGEAMVMVPRDDDKRAFSDSLLPAAMIEAGGDAVDRADLDMRNYVSGQTIDWDSGMIAVAVYRAMLAAAPPQAGNSRDGVLEEAARVADETKSLAKAQGIYYSQGFLHGAHTVARNIRALARGRE